VLPSRLSSLIEKLYRKAEEGFDTVTACRSSRIGETLLKKAISAVRYKLIMRGANSPQHRRNSDRYCTDLGLSCPRWCFGAPLNHGREVVHFARAYLHQTESDHRRGDTLGFSLGSY